MRNRLLGASILAVLLAAAATGARADSSDWAGFYLGLNAGYSFGTAQSRTTTVDPPGGYFATSSIPAIADVGNQHLNPEGFIGGGQMGFNFAVDDNWVLGLEADLEANSITDKETRTGGYPCCAPSSFTIGSKVESTWLATLRPVVGYAWANVMIYATGGLALHDEKASFAFTDDFAAAAANGGFSTTKGTWTVGGGVQGKIDRNWSWRAEYLFVDYGRVGGTSANLAAGTPPVSFPQNPFSQTAYLNGNAVRVAVNYRL